MKKSILWEAASFAGAKIHTHPQYRHFIHFSFVVQNNKIVEWGTNSAGVPKKHFGYHRLGSDANFCPKMHSELNAWNKAKGLLDKNKSFEIINIRLNRQGNLRMSKPCSCCHYLLKELGCHTFHYSYNDGFLLVR